MNKRTKLIGMIGIIFIFTMFVLTMIMPVSANQIENDSLYIIDNANLLSDEEEISLKKVMEPITEFGGIAFVSTSSNNSTSESYAKNKYRDCFGNSSGTLFLIDMDNREVYIFSDGKNYRLLNKARAYEITDNVYTYATDGDYYECAKEAFIQIDKVLNNEMIFAPMRYITGILAGICTSLLVSILIVYVQRKHKYEECDITEDVETYIIERHDRLINVTKTKHTSSSGGSGGGGGGGSSGGGGGHSF